MKTTVEGPFTIVDTEAATHKDVQGNVVQDPRTLSKLEALRKGRKVRRIGPTRYLFWK